MNNVFIAVAISDSTPHEYLCLNVTSTDLASPAQSAVSNKAVYVSKSLLCGLGPLSIVSLPRLGSGLNGEALNLLKPIWIINDIIKPKMDRGHGSR